MSEFRFYHPIEVRYGDLDPQGHVNNAKYLTYFEQARVHYLLHLGLFEESHSFTNIGIILADAHVTFLASIQFGQPVRVGVRTSRLGNKSMTMEYRLEDAETGQELATGSTVLVAYDYRTNETIPIPEEWREKINRFEGLQVAG
jgi:acyl-CoA thioester hydrolase